eukprot:g1881.t1
MGAFCSRTRRKSSTTPAAQSSGTQQSNFHPVLDKYESPQELQDALKDADLKIPQLIVGVDFTKSNEWTGKTSFDGKCLHSIDEKQNFYERAIYAVVKPLEPFLDNKQILAYGFGDVTTKGNGLFPFNINDVPANGLDSALVRYRQIAPRVELSGPKSFAPVIHHAIKLVIDSGLQYHILVILADGQVSSKKLEDTQDAIVAASYFPLSIIMIGVGDGPWDQMEIFDDHLPKRLFDNFQFVNFCKVMDQASVYGTDEAKINAHFAVNALMEIPDQYKEIQKLQLAAKDSSWYFPNDQLLFPVPPTITQTDQSNVKSG